MRTPPFISGSALSHLECARCARREDADRPRTVCPACGGPLYARYNLDRPDLTGLPWDFGQRPADLWRYAELLPVRTARFRSGLGEGMTPMIETPRLASAIGIESLHIKDEGRNPTGSFKARGMAVAVARAAELGARALTAPSAGNAGLALAAYAARHNVRALVAFPIDIPGIYVRLSRSYGAEVITAGATIREAGAALRAHAQEKAAWRDALDVSTLREPYRLEGKKTMGYEIAEQMLGDPPDVILYPTGGGTGLIGIWKAFEEIAELGWMGPSATGLRPRMIAVQMKGCAPIVDAMVTRAERATPVGDAQTRCWGLRVPSPFADREILDVLRASHGGAIAVGEEELVPAADRTARCEGIDLSPEGAAVIAAIPRLIERSEISPTDRILALNTAGSAMYQ
jgi:threonine synthase